MDTFITNWCSSSIKWLKWVTPYQIVTKFVLRQAATLGFVDAWVFVHLLGASAAWLVTSPGSQNLCLLFFLLYGGARVFELALYNIEVLLGKPSDKAPRVHKRGRPYKVRSIRRSVVLAVLNYVEVLLWFAAFYRFFVAHFSTESLVSTITGSLYLSALTMSANGDIGPKDNFSRCLVTIHLGLAIFLTLFVLSRFVSALPRLKSMDANEKD